VAGAVLWYSMRWLEVLCKVPLYALFIILWYFDRSINFFIASQVRSKSIEFRLEGEFQIPEKPQYQQKITTGEARRQFETRPNILCNKKT
jgi:hypothetical protein